MCVWLGRGGRCWDLVGDNIGFELYQFWRNMGKLRYVCVLVAVVWVGGLGQGLGGWVLCMCVLGVDYLC